MSTIANFETLHINILTKALVVFFFLINTPYFVVDFQNLAIIASENLSSFPIDFEEWNCSDPYCATLEMSTLTTIIPVFFINEAKKELFNGSSQYLQWDT